MRDIDPCATQRALNSSMNRIKASVIIPTHSRPRKLEQLLDCLKHQDVSPGDYEIIVVDDNSLPPVALKNTEGAPETSLIRLEETERSAARNTGAEIARGDLLLFVDDDMTVSGDFISNHLHAHEQYPGALAVGSVRLPEKALATPFGRFRQKLEDNELPDAGGPITIENFCTAANMSIARDRFLEIGRFDPSIVSSEDQDFALRHTARGGQIIFAPEARAIHCDHALDIRSYCRRAEWGSERMIPFCRRYPDWPDNVERDRVNGPLRFDREPVSQSMRKLIKVGLAARSIIALLFAVASLLERLVPNSRVLDRVYRLLLGAHIFRGYRKGLKRSTVANQPAPKGRHRIAQGVSPGLPVLCRPQRGSDATIDRVTQA